MVIKMHANKGMGHNSVVEYLTPVLEELELSYPTVFVTLQPESNSLIYKV